MRSWMMVYLSWRSQDLRPLGHQTALYQYVAKDTYVRFKCNSQYLFLFFACVFTVLKLLCAILATFELLCRFVSSGQR